MCACVILEVLVRMVNGRGAGDIQLKEYEKFARRWLPTYWSFVYRQKTVTITQHKKGGVIIKKRRRKSLPSQMYLILRCGLVHTFSFVASKKQFEKGGRTRSIWMVSQAEANAAGQAHLTRFSRTNPLPAVEDACYFVGERFIEDLVNAVDAIFDEATTNKKLRDNIEKHLNLQRPIGQ